MANDFPHHHNPRLGQYSNDPATYFDQVQAARQRVVKSVGEYDLTLHPKWRTYEVSRKDGKAVPKGLRGRWSGVDSFRKALERHEGAA